MIMSDVRFSAIQPAVNALPPKGSKIEVTPIINTVIENAVADFKKIATKICNSQMFVELIEKDETIRVSRSEQE